MATQGIICQNTNRANFINTATSAVPDRPHKGGERLEKSNFAQGHGCKPDEKAGRRPSVLFEAQRVLKNVKKILKAFAQNFLEFTRAE